MNVYDFDRTIYRHDCSVDFYLYEIRRHPLLLRYLPIQIVGWAGYFLRLHDKTVMKDFFYRYLKGIRDIDEEVKSFWDSHIHLIHDWYRKIQRPDDLVISASASFMVEPACQRLGIKNVLASEVDRYSGRVTGPNCHGKQKPVRFQAAGYDESEIEQFYSDSYSDQPMADLARESFLVKGEQLISWQKGSRK